MSVISLSFHVIHSCGACRHTESSSINLGPTTSRMRDICRFPVCLLRLFWPTKTQWNKTTSTRYTFYEPDGFDAGAWYCPAINFCQFCSAWKFPSRQRLRRLFRHITIADPIRRGTLDLQDRRRNYLLAMIQPDVSIMQSYASCAPNSAFHLSEAFRESWKLHLAGSVSIWPSARDAATS